MKIRLILLLNFFIVLGVNSQVNVLKSLNGDFEKGNIDHWRAVEVRNGSVNTIEMKGGVPIPSTNAEIVGSSHAAPKYYFGTDDCLNEGADFLLSTGSKVIKIWYYNGGEKPSIMYPWNSSWLPASINKLEDGLHNTHYTTLFDKPFKTFIMNISSLANIDPFYWRTSLSQSQIDQEENEFYEFTKALLNKYAGTGKTFILQHHEGDWHTRGNTDASIPASDEVHARMTDWLNARQRGVTKARNESTSPNVAVYHAAEVNIVVNSMNDGQANMVNAVLPNTNLDLVSYSAYDSCLKPAENNGSGDTQLFVDALRYIKTMMPDSDVFGNDNVYVGEYGVPENNYTSNQIQAVMTNTVESSLVEKIPYIIYWNLYDNELVDHNTPLPITENADVRGFWLKKPDGTSSWRHDYLKTKINE